MRETLNLYYLQKALLMELDRSLRRNGIIKIGEKAALNCTTDLEGHVIVEVSMPCL